MRVVAIAIITALLSAGCAIQAGDPPPEETQRPNELVGISGGSELPGVSAHPEVSTRTSLGQNGPAADSPNPSPWTGGPGDPQQGNTNGNTSGQDNGGTGTGGQQDNPNPSPWNNPNGPHWGGIGSAGAKPGTGG